MNSANRLRFAAGRAALHRRFEQLEPRRLLAFGSLVISEFSAKNDSAFVDADGDSSDWIEIHNPTDESIDLNGWTLTDNRDQLKKWTFPAIELAANSYDIIFASAKNRREPNQELHTNFKLSGDGEYLGLADPGGAVVSEFSPTYPAFESNVSYGFPSSRNILIDGADRYAYRVAVEETPAWNSADFDDTEWERAVGIVGFDTRPDLPNAGFERGNLTAWDSNGNVSVQQSSFGIEPIGGDHFALLDSTGSTLTRRRAEQFLNLDSFSLDDVIGAPVARVSAVKREVTVDVGSVVEFDWQLLTNDQVNQDFGFFSISDGLEILPLGTVFDDPGPSPTAFANQTPIGTFRHVFSEPGTFTIGIGVAQANNTVNDSALVLDNFTVDGRSDAGSSYRSIIATDVADQLAMKNGSLLLRYEFDLSDPNAVRGLQLNARFDDGFVASVNGTEVVSANAPDSRNWDASASNARSNRDAIGFESFFLDSSMLRLGRNVLAIQVLNHSNDLEDLLWEANFATVGPLAEEPVFFTEPTPGFSNLTTTRSFVDAVHFDVPAGFYDEPIAVSMSVDTPDAEIWYTLDGSQPSATNGTKYLQSLTIDSSTVVRAIAFRENALDGQTTTVSYLFADDVLSQSRGSAIAAGFPASWGEQRSADYAMDRKVIGPGDRFGGKYADTIRDDLLSVPSISLVMDQRDLFGETGIYSNLFGRGAEWERPTSVEIIYPDGNPGFQIDAGIRLQGGISRVIGQKLSFRLMFRDKYGSAKLDYPLFGNDGPTEFDSIALRSSSGELLVGRHFIRDEFVRRVQLATGNPSARGTFMHLYINGVYWGLYNPSERIDSQFAVNHDGGRTEDYDVLNASDLGGEGVNVVDGSKDAWEELVRQVRSLRSAPSQTAKTAALLRLEGKNGDGENDDEIEAYLDIDNFIDYLIVNVFAGNRDWPHRNYYMYRQRGPESEGFKFQVWDAEFTLDSGFDSLRMANLTEGPTAILPGLLTSEAFAVRFSDRAHKHFSPGGALYVNPESRVWNPASPFNNVPASVYAGVAAEARSPLVAESARWGDANGLGGGDFFTRDEDWETLVRDNLRYFASRSTNVLAGLRLDNLYSAPPSFSIAPGKVEPGTRLRLNPDGVADVYYTLDGTDPRRPDGRISDAAVQFRTDLIVNDRVKVRMRSRSDGVWSAIETGTFLTDSVPAASSNLTISEINYNPLSAQASFGETQGDNDQFEFIELQNIGSETVDLTGVRLEQQFSHGVAFEFGQQTLGVGEYTTIPRNISAFESRYGRLPNMAVGTSIAGNGWHFDGSLDNGGDVIRVVGSNEQLIQQLAYDDSRAWPGRADGGGSSLEPIDLFGDLSDPTNWRSSSEFGGSPGTAGRGPDNRVVINEVRANSANPFVDQIELRNNTNSSIDINHWYLSDSRNDFFKFQFEAPTVIAPNGYWSLLQGEFRFEIDGRDGDDVYLIEADANGRPTYFVDRVEFDAMAVNRSLARWPDGHGRLYPASETSFGRPNEGPMIGDVVISEVQASSNAEGVDGFSDPRELEFIELFNRSNQAIDLSSWKIRGDAHIDFSLGQTIDPGQVLTIVGFDPSADPTKAALFRLLYQSTGVLVGPYSGRLGDDSGTVRLTRPLGLEIDPHVVVDEVRYDTADGWPSNTIKSDNSIQRVTPSAFGSFAISWKADRATPGTAEFGNLVGDLTQDGVIDIEDVDAICSAIHASELNSVTDVNSDQAINTGDLYFLVTNILGTTAGDANLDGVFNSADLVLVFQASTFEDEIEDNSSWVSGDWNCDGDFTTFDLVVAFRAAAYSAPGLQQTIVAGAIDGNNEPTSTNREATLIGHGSDKLIQSRPRFLFAQVVDSLFDS